MSKAHAFHAHVYFDERTAAEAEAFCHRAGEELGVRVGRFHRKLVGPHPRWSCQLSERIERLGPVLVWLAENRGELTIFTHLVTDEMQRRFTVISGTPEECLEITQELVDAGLNLPMLEVVGETEEDNLETIRLFGEEVLPKLRPAPAPVAEAS